MAIDNPKSYYSQVTYKCRCRSHYMIPKIRCTFVYQNSRIKGTLLGNLKKKFRQHILKGISIVILAQRISL